MSIPTADQHERSIIGAMLINPGCRKEVLSMVSPEDFFSERNQAIVRAFRAVGQGDYLELVGELERSGYVNGNGDSEEMGRFLSKIIQETPTSTGTGYSAGKIRNAALRREMFQMGHALAQDARDPQLDVGEILEGRITELKAIQEQQKASGISCRKGLDVCVIDYNQLMNMEVLERVKLFSWLPEGGLAMVYGPRGLGKTFFVSSLAVSLTTGAPFMKWGAPLKPVGVLIVDGEMALADLRERLSLLLTVKPVCPLKLISSEVVFSETERDINLVAEQQRRDILNVIDEDKSIRLVIIDNISCLFSGLRESSKDDWETVTPWLLSLRRRGVAVVLVHHAGKGGDQRGTSGREDMLDSVIRLEHPHGAGNDGARFVVRFTKCRNAYGADIDPFEAALDLEKPEKWSWRPVEDSTYERMLALVEAGVETVRDMAEELGVTNARISMLKSRGIKEGMLKKGRKIEIKK